MDIIFNDLPWMIYNIFLAFLPVFFAWLFFFSKQKGIKFIFAVLWFLFLPNTIYTVTDFIHLLEDAQKVHAVALLVLVMQYSVLEFAGLIFFVLAMYPLELLLQRSAFTKRGNTTLLILVVCNFLVGFGIVLGRVQRVNSWQVFTNPEKVYQAVLAVIHFSDQMFLFFLFGLFINFFYFLFRKQIVTRLHKVFTLLSVDKHFRKRSIVYQTKLTQDRHPNFPPG